MPIDKVKFPNGETEDIRDSRIPGIDSAPTSGSANLVTSGGVKFALDGYLPLTGGTMSGAIVYPGSSYEIIRTGGSDTTWRGGLKYSWTNNTTIALWGKNNMSQFVWHAGTDFSENDVNGTVTRNYDFQVGRNGTGSLEALIGGNLIWHQGNDGLGSGLDADLLDGKHATDFIGVNDNAASATRIKETTLEDEEFTYQATPVHDIADAYRIDRIKGRTLAFNQLCSDGTVTEIGQGAFFPHTIQQGHKVLISYDVMKSTDFEGAWQIGLSLSDGGDTYGGSLYCSETPADGAFHTVRGIVDNNDSKNRNFFYRINATSGSMTIKNANAIDLTLMFGSGNEPSTVEEFEAMFPLPYYGYNEGELVSVAAEGIETVGFNLWDEEWGLGYWNTGTGIRTYYPGEYCTENPIQVIAGKTYYVKNAVANYVIFYDKDMNYLSDASYEMTFTPPAGSAYAQINFGAFPGSYNHDICINLSDASRNGTYEPHWSKVLPLGLDAFKVKDSQGNIITVNGLAGAGDVRDEIRGGKYIKRIGRVDLGTLMWTKGNAQTYDSNLSNFYTMNFAVNVESGGDLICGKYANDTSGKLEWEARSPYSISMDGNQYLVVVDSGTYTGETLKTALSGVYLYYELATPVIYDLVSPVPLSGRIDGNGTMRVISDNIVAPFNGDITYGCNPGQIAADSNALMGYVNSVFDLRYYETSEPSGGMLPNREYQLGTLSGNTTFTLAAGTSGVTNHYFWSFETGSTAPTITWPAAITSWYGGSAPTISASKHYEVSVLNGVAVVMEV